MYQDLCLFSQVYFAKCTIDCRGLKMEYVAQRGRVEDLMAVNQWAVLVYIVWYAKVSSNS